MNIGPEIGGVCLQLGWSVEGMRRIQRHASELLPRLFMLVAENLAAAGPGTLQQVPLADCSSVIICNFQLYSCNSQRPSRA